MSTLHGTTIIGVKKDNKVTIAGDGQVTQGNTVIKSTARKIRVIANEGFKIISGFAGSTADAFTLIERLEKKLENYPGQLSKACVELAKDWRTDKYLRNLEAMMIVSDGVDLLIITGSGDVLEPENNIAAVGSGGNFALAAAKALYSKHSDPAKIAIESLKIASEICVFTNDNIICETLEGKKIDK